MLSEFSPAAPSMLGDDEYAALEALGRRGKALATKIFGAIAGRKVELHEVRFAEVTPEDLELTYRGAFLMAQVELHAVSGDIHPCLTLISKDEVGLLMGVPEDDAAMLAEQSTKLGDVAEVVVDSINLSLPPVGDRSPELRFAGVREIDVEDVSPIVELIGHENLVEISYPLAEASGGGAQISHLTTMGFVRGLVEGQVRLAQPAAPAASVGSGLGGAAFGGFGGSPADSGGLGLGGGFGMSDFGAGGPLPGYGEPPTVRPAQFGAFTGMEESTSSSNIDLIMDISLRITVELGRSTMSIREILDLGPGSVIELDKLAGEPVDILVNDRPIAKGEVVVVDENFGVRVTDIISPARRVAGLR